jgi:hypothetical protein
LGWTLKNEMKKESCSSIFKSTEKGRVDHSECEERRRIGRVHGNENHCQREIRKGRDVVKI